MKLNKWNSMIFMVGSCVIIETAYECIHAFFSHPRNLITDQSSSFLFMRFGRIQY